MCRAPSEREPSDLGLLVPAFEAGQSEEVVEGLFEPGGRLDRVEPVHFTGLLDQPDLGFLPTTRSSTLGQVPHRGQLGLLALGNLNGLERRHRDHATVILHLQLISSCGTSRRGQLSDGSCLGELVVDEGASFLAMLMKQTQRGGAVHLDTGVVTLELGHRLAAGLVAGQVHGGFFDDDRPCLSVRAQQGVERTVRVVAGPTIDVGISNRDRSEGCLPSPLSGPVHTRGETTRAGPPLCFRLVEAHVHESLEQSAAQFIDEAEETKPTSPSWR